MRLALLAVTVLSACVRPAHARSHATYLFAGEKLVTVIGPDEDVRGLEAFLVARGIRVSLLLPGSAAPPVTRYVLSISGVCGTNFSRPTLRIDGHDVSRANQRVFVSEVINRTDCPVEFFREASLDIARWWQEDAGGDDPDLPER